MMTTDLGVRRQPTKAIARGKSDEPSMRSCEIVDQNERRRAVTKFIRITAKGDHVTVELVEDAFGRERVQQRSVYRTLEAARTLSRQNVAVPSESSSRRRTNVATVE